MLEGAMEYGYGAKRHTKDRERKDETMGLLTRWAC